MPQEITTQQIVTALAVLTGFAWEEYEGEIFFGAENGELKDMQTNKQLTRANVLVHCNGKTHVGTGLRITLKPGYDAEELVALSNEKIQQEGGVEKVFENWRNLKDKDTTRDPEAVKKVKEALTTLYPDAGWEMFEVSPDTCVRAIICSHPLKAGRVEEIHAFLERIGFGSIFGLEIGSDDQEVGITYFDKKGFAALMRAAAVGQQVSEAAENTVKAGTVNVTKLYAPFDGKTSGI